jgi:hypothetical protein
MSTKRFRTGYLGFLETLFSLPKNSLGDDAGVEVRCRAAVSTAFNVLLPRYRFAVEKYYGLDCCRDIIRAIASELGVTSSRINQMIQKGFRTLRNGTDFDQIALTLTERGHSSHYLLIASDRGRMQPGIEAVKERLKDHFKAAPLVEFLIDHKVGCTEDNPCPTCRARTLFATLGISDQIQALIAEWHDDGLPNLLDIAIDLVLPNLSIRTRNCLKNDDVTTLRQLMSRTEAEMLRTPNFGRKSLNELKERLAVIGFKLRTTY